MAISKKRLEELIKEGATIYDKDSYSINLSKTDSFMKNIFEFYYMIEDNRLLKVQKQPHIALNQWWIKDLFETKEDAEWHLKYRRTRTEELDLPTWEEFITDDKYKYHYGLSFFDFDNYRLIACIPTEDDNTEFIGIDVDDNTELYHWDEATEENYTKACDVCLKLFKGDRKC